MKLQAPYRYLAMLLVLFSTLAAATAEPAQAPDKLVAKVTQTMLADIASYRDALASAKGDAQKQALLTEFYDRLAANLRPVVDFNWIALNVMGQYRGQASAEQRQQFRQVFTRALVETYGRGLLSYSNQEIVVQPLADLSADQRRVTVVQEIRGTDKSYPLLYSMGKKKNGEWKVINVIINGINLGNTFRNQFAQAAAKHNGDIDRVIASWTVADTET
jgi:phospholipid transport system substrate-binding protein